MSENMMNLQGLIGGMDTLLCCRPTILRLVKIFAFDTSKMQCVNRTPARMLHTAAADCTVSSCFQVVKCMDA